MSALLLTIVLAMVPPGDATSLAPDPAPPDPPSTTIPEVPGTEPTGTHRCPDPSPGVDPGCSSTPGGGVQTERE